MTGNLSISRRSETLGTIAVFILLAAVPIVTASLGDAYLVTFISRVLVMGIAALSLNLALGFGGMTSLGHAAFMGVGAYTVGIMMSLGVVNGFTQFAVVIFLGSLTALGIGAMCLRASGLSFIMLTLAFAQLVYFVGVGLKQFGGDDGFSFKGRSVFTEWIDLNNDVTFYYFILTWLVMISVILQRVVSSRFGCALRGIKSNSARMSSLGLHPYRYNLVAFVISGTLCALAGALLANLTQFVSPSYMHWSRSAELLLMALLGGMATVLGPLAGAAAFLFLEEALGRVTQHWQAPMGVMLILVVLLAKNGLSDVGAFLTHLWSRVRAGNPDRLPARKVSGVSDRSESEASL